jgi:hypothetical protein
MPAGITMTSRANSEVGLDQEREETLGAGQVQRRRQCGHSKTGNPREKFTIHDVGKVRQGNVACQDQMVEGITPFVTDCKGAAGILRTVGFMSTIVLFFVVAMAIVAGIDSLRRFVRRTNVCKDPGYAKCGKHLQSPDGYEEHGQRALHGNRALSASIATDSYCGRSLSLSAMEEAVM